MSATRTASVPEPTRERQPQVDNAPPTPFEDFYRAEFHSVVGFAYALSGSRLAAEELAQDAFLAAHRRWERIGRYERPGSWVRLVVTNAARSRVRRAMAEGRALLRFVSQRRDLPVAIPERDAEFWAAVRILPPMQASSVALYYYDDLSVSDIAALLGCSESTVRVHLHRGRAALARRLGCEDLEDR